MVFGEGGVVVGRARYLVIDLREGSMNMDVVDYGG